MNQERKISALKNGTVIDHIKTENTLKAVKILKLKDEQLMIGINFESKKYGRKGVIKISDKDLGYDELNKIAFVAPRASIIIIKNYEVIKKSDVRVPKEFIGVAKCGNLNCITNHDAVKTHFYTISQDPIKVRCKYCEKTFDNTQLEIL